MHQYRNLQVVPQIAETEETSLKKKVPSEVYLDRHPMKFLNQINLWMLFLQLCRKLSVSGNGKNERTSSRGPEEERAWRRGCYWELMAFVPNSGWFRNDRPPWVHSSEEWRCQSPFQTRNRYQWNGGLQGAALIQSAR